jgi:oxaloacetate decarboxylase alpha subunit
MPKIVDETLRDSHQSLWATRMKTKSMLPILKSIDEAVLME